MAVICNVSPSSGNLEESISTLKFASRAKKIVATVSISEQVDEHTLLKKYREEISKLRHELEEARKLASVSAL